MDQMTNLGAIRFHLFWSVESSSVAFPAKLAAELTQPLGTIATSPARRRGNGRRRPDLDGRGPLLLDSCCFISPLALDLRKLST